MWRRLVAIENQKIKIRLLSFTSAENIQLSHRTVAGVKNAQTVSPEEEYDHLNKSGGWVHY